MQKELQLRANEIEMSYNEAGDKNSLPVIFIHGFPFDKSTWDGQLEALSKNFRCIAYDIRGFGKTDFGNEEFSIELFADDLIAFMDILQINRAVVCGLSMGGYIALRAVAKYPQRISALILPDTQCIADSAEGKERRYKTISQIEQFGLDAYAEASLKNLFCEKSFANKKDEVEKIRQTILGTSPATVIAALKALAKREESCSVLGEINIPTLILCGAEDKITPLAQAEFLKQNISNSSLEIIEGAAHITNIEQPEIFNAHLEKFLNGIQK